MNARTTLKLTSASSSATRTSRNASWMLSGVRRPRPPRRSKTPCSLVLRESNMANLHITQPLEQLQCPSVVGRQGARGLPPLPCAPLLDGQAHPGRALGGDPVPGVEGLHFASRELGEE